MNKIIKEYKVGDYVKYKDNFDQIRDGKIESIHGNKAKIKAVHNNVLTFITDEVPLNSIKNKISGQKIKENILIKIIRKEIKNIILESSFEPEQFKLITKNNIYISKKYDITLKFISKEFKENWCRLKFRVYSTKYGTGGFLVDVILQGNMNELLEQIDNIAYIPKKKYGNLDVIHRKTNNNVSQKYKGNRKDY